jgi:UDP-N-acetylmuramoylalanine--D-glutamate ligase
MKISQTKQLQQLQQKLGLEVESAKVLVVGLGSTGLSVARFLKNLGFQLAIVDSRDKPPQVDELAESMSDVAVFSGGFDQAAFDVATHLVVSPGVSLQEHSIQRAIAAGCRIVSDIDLFACATNKPVIAITGSNGKSTVTTLLGEMAKACGIKVAIGGNLGVPALDLLDETTELYVLELSSFQLERTRLLEPVGATVLNISEDHLDRHYDLEQYARAKQQIFNGQGVMVLNQDDERVMAMQAPNRDIRTFSIKQVADYWWDREQNQLKAGETNLIPAQDLILQGSHNIANALAAIALGDAAGIARDAMMQVLRQFKGLPHRMQLVSKTKGVHWINDSKATNVGACVAALNGFSNNVILIAGGDAKGADLNDLVPAVTRHCKAVIVMGKDGAAIAESLHGRLPVFRAEPLDEAVKVADSLAQPGDVVLLSPACASLDQYKNYKQRGELFMQAVMQLEQVA